MENGTCRYRLRGGGCRRARGRDTMRVCLGIRKCQPRSEHARVHELASTSRRERGVERQCVKGMRGCRSSAAKAQHENRATGPGSAKRGARTVSPGFSKVQADDESNHEGGASRTRESGSSSAPRNGTEASAKRVGSRVYQAL